MNDGPLISVCMPVYNAERFVIEALDSVFRQSYPNIEVICVDDGSTDSSLELLRAFEGNIKIIESKNRGAPHARNLAFQSSNGDLIQFFDADNLLEEHKLARQAQAIREFDVDMVFCNKRVLKDTSDKPLDLSPLVPVDTLDPFLYCLKYNLPGGRAAIDTDVPLHRRRMIEAIGGFREGVVRGQDKDLAFRLAAAGASFHYVDEVLVTYRDHNGPRISNIKKPAGFHVEYFIELIEILLSNPVYQLTDKRRIELAIVLSRFSKDAFRQGARDVALKGFSFARRLTSFTDPDESRAYRIIRSISGYSGAEWVRSVLQR